MAGVGPAPKPASKRRHHNPPAAWGRASPVTSGCRSPTGFATGVAAERRHR